MRRSTVHDRGSGRTCSAKPLATAPIAFASCVCSLPQPLHCSSLLPPRATALPGVAELALTQALTSVVPSSRQCSLHQPTSHAVHHSNSSPAAPRQSQQTAGRDEEAAPTTRRGKRTRSKTRSKSGRKSSARQSSRYSAAQPAAEEEDQQSEHNITFSGVKVAKQAEQGGGEKSGHQGGPAALTCEPQGHVLGSFHGAEVWNVYFVFYHMQRLWCRWPDVLRACTAAYPALPVHRRGGWR